MICPCLFLWQWALSKDNWLVLWILREFHKIESGILEMLEVVISWWWIIQSQPLQLLSLSIWLLVSLLMADLWNWFNQIPFRSWQRQSHREKKTQTHLMEYLWKLFSSSHFFDPAEVLCTISYAEKGMKVPLSIMMVNCTVASKYIDPSVRDFIPVSLISRKKRRTSQDWSSLFPPLDDQ